MFRHSEGKIPLLIAVGKVMSQFKHFIFQRKIYLLHLTRMTIKKMRTMIPATKPTIRAIGIGLEEAAATLGNSTTEERKLFQL